MRQEGVVRRGGRAARGGVRRGVACGERGWCGEGWRAARGVVRREGDVPTGRPSRRRRGPSWSRRGRGDRPRPRAAAGTRPNPGPEPLPEHARISTRAGVEMIPYPGADRGPDRPTNTGRYFGYPHSLTTASPYRRKNHAGRFVISHRRRRGSRYGRSRHGRLDGGFAPRRRRHGDFPVAGIGAMTWGGEPRRHGGPAPRPHACGGSGHCRNAPRVDRHERSRPPPRHRGGAAER